MQKIIAAIYGEKAVGILKDSFEALTDEQRCGMMCNIVDSINEALRDKPSVPKEDHKIVIQGILERAIEIMPSLKEKLEEEVREVLEEETEDDI